MAQKGRRKTYLFFEEEFAHILKGLINIHILLGAGFVENGCADFLFEGLSLLYLNLLVVYIVSFVAHQCDHQFAHVRMLFQIIKPCATSV